jgi:hypothetical protein
VDILDSDLKTKLTGGYGNVVIGLPPGTYGIQLAGTTQTITVQAGKITDF